jgi:hypothetical protein
MTQDRMMWRTVVNTISLGAISRLTVQLVTDSRNVLHRIKSNAECGLALTDSGEVPVAASCGHVKRSRGPLKGWEFPD